MFILSCKPVKNMLDEAVNSFHFHKDAAFDGLYPEHIQGLSQRHWTPLEVAKKASAFLALPNAKILDIGSGVGKFCIIAGFYHPQTFFYGVEQRKELVRFSQMVNEEVNLANVGFIHGNLTAIDFKAYDHFYFFNSFHENIEPGGRIDNTVNTSSELYVYYSRFLIEMMDEKPAGTRLVTFHGREKQIPASFHLVDHAFSGRLKMWIKK